MNKQNLFADTFGLFTEEQIGEIQIFYVKNSRSNIQFIRVKKSYIDGSIRYFIRPNGIGNLGYLHNLEGPAVISSSGTEEYYIWDYPLDKINFQEIVEKIRNYTILK